MDTVTKEKRGEIMSKIRGESGIERLPAFLRGFYLRKHPRGILGKPDFANKSKKIALFIDGCFWHFCPIHHRLPKTNKRFWRNKVNRNTVRDVLVTGRLMADDWIVVRVWEHNLKGGEQCR